MTILIRDALCDVGCSRSGLLSQLLLRFAVAIGTLELKSSLCGVHGLHNESLRA